jgi:hypothetical protein
MKAQKTLAQLAAEKTAANAAAQTGAAQTSHTPGVPKNNVQIDAKIDAFAAENPKLVEYYQSLPKERLVRACLLARANEEERQVRRQERQYVELKKWVDQSPELKASIDAKLAAVPDEQKTGAFVNLARRAQEYAGRQSLPVAPRPPGQSIGV